MIGDSDMIQNSDHVELGGMERYAIIDIENISSDEDSKRDLSSHID